jgi:hypothetical protein
MLLECMIMLARFFAALRMTKKLLINLPKRNIHPWRVEWFKKKKSLGNDLLSQGVAPVVPSALADLTAGFGMLPGVSPPRESPRDCFHEVKN